MKLPAVDSAPLVLTKLTPKEQELLRDVNILVEGIRTHANNLNKIEKENADDFWATFEEDRRHRVIMLDGRRGAGKTSLMLTLMKLWGSFSGSRPGYKKKKIPKWAKHIVRSGKSLRVLRPLDFDPMPQGMSVYGWICHAFAPIVDRLESGDHYDSNPIAAFAATKKDIGAEFRELERCIAKGWNSGKLHSKDVEDYIVQSKGQYQAWHDISGRFRRFLDLLFEKLDCVGANVFPKHGLMVLPIDDIDLQVERSRDLVNALRYLRHNRLVYLLNADVPALRDRLALSFHAAYAPAEAKFGEGSIDEVREASVNLATQLISKVIPKAHTFGVTRAVILRSDWQNGIPGENGYPHKDGLVGQLLRKLDAIHPQKRWKRILCRATTASGPLKLTWRSLQQFSDYADRLVEESDQQFVLRLLEAILDNPEEERIEVNASDDRRKIEIVSTEPQTVEVVVDSVETQGSESVEVDWQVAGSFEFRSQKEDRESHPDGSPPPKRVQTPQYVLFCMDLARLAPNDVLNRYGLVFSQPEAGFAWTQRIINDEVFFIPWPHPRAESPGEWMAILNKWREYSPEGPLPDKNWNAGEQRAWAWIACFLRKSEGQLVSFGAGDAVELMAACHGFSRGFVKWVENYSHEHSGPEQTNEATYLDGAAIEIERVHQIGRNEAKQFRAGVYVPHGSKPGKPGSKEAPHPLLKDMKIQRSKDHSDELD